MKEITVKVFEFHELSDKAKQYAIDKWRDNNTEIFWADENRHSMEKFAEIFPIKVTNWSYGGRGEGVTFHFTADDAIEELKGQRLATYLWNNYRSQIYSKIYYKSWTSDKRIKHPHVKSELIEEKKWKRRPDLWGKYYNTYYGSQIEEYNCPLTGYCMDNELLDEIWKFIKKPDNRNFKDLLEDCFDSWIKACNADIEEQNSDEFIGDHLQANNYKFTEDGRVFR